MKNKGFTKFAYLNKRLILYKKIKTIFTLRDVGMIFSKKLFTFLAICLSAVICCGAPAEDTLDSVFFRDFDDDSYFVTIPTYTGNYLGLVVGAIPAACVASGFQFANENPSAVRESARVTLAVFSKTIGLLFGLPFKLTKVVFWDSPKYVYGGITGYTDPPVQLPENTRE